MALRKEAVQVVIDCADPVRVAQFWAAALGYKVEWEWNDETKAWMESNGLTEDDFHSRAAVSDPEGRGPRFFLQRVPEAKAGKNRLHVDVKTDGDLEAEKDRLVGLGAAVLHKHEGDWGPFHEVHYVMQDPEGNEFCLSANP